MVSAWSMHEIFPLVPTGPPALISPAARGELSRRSPSELAVQNVVPLTNGLVGNSRMWLFPAVGLEFLSPVAGLTGLRKISATRRSLVTTMIALRSLASTQMLP